LPLTASWKRHGRTLGLIESRSDEGPASVEEDAHGNAEREGFVTGHSMGFDAERFNAGLRL
jgi:hypothetical protein